MINRMPEFLSSKIAAGDFPSAVYGFSIDGISTTKAAHGFSVVEPKKIEAGVDTIYDLASLTKPLITGLLCVKMIENGEIDLSDYVSKFFPDFETSEKCKITIESLLTHTSGFAAWKPFYFSGSDKSKTENVRDQIALEPLANPVGEKVVYSDFNFLLLGFLIEKFSGKSLDELARLEIFEPLKLKDTFFNPPGELKPRIAASEKGNGYEEQTAQDLFPEIRIPKSAFRNQMIWGEVHDNNCCFLDGVAGHAGLFSNVTEVLKIAHQFLAETTEILKPETCQLFRKNFTPKLNQARSLAFQLAETEDSTASEALSRDSFGHLGFTGTSLWIDPTRARVFILLTNRTHNRNLPFADLKETRQNFHRIATESLDSIFWK